MFSFTVYCGSTGSLPYKTCWMASEFACLNKPLLEDFSIQGSLNGVAVISTVAVTTQCGFLQLLPIVKKTCMLGKFKLPIGVAVRVCGCLTLHIIIVTNWA